MVDKVQIPQPDPLEEHVHEAPADTDHTERRGFLSKILMASGALMAALIMGRGDTWAQSRWWGRRLEKRDTPLGDPVHPQILDRPEAFRSPPGTLRFKGREEITIERFNKGFRTVLQHSHHVRR